MKTVSIPTGYAWFIVNYQTENGLKMNKEVEEFANLKIHHDIFNPLFFNENFKVNYSFSSMHTVLYEFLRPEIITQHPKILKCISSCDAKKKLGEELILSTELQYKHHKEW